MSKAASSDPDAAAPDIDLVDLDIGAGFGSEDYVFKRPFKLNGVAWRKVTLRAPIGRDVRMALPGLAGTEKEFIDLIARLSDGKVDAEMLDRVVASDRNGIYALVGKLLAGSGPQPT